MCNKTSLETLLFQSFNLLDNVPRGLVRSLSLYCILLKPSRLVSVTEVLVIITRPWSIFILLFRVVIPELWLRVGGTDPGITLTWWLRMNLLKHKRSKYIYLIRRFVV